MNLSIGRGHSRLDLSDMMINRLDMKSHFAEVFIQYNKPNRMSMEKMHVQSIQGKVVLKNLELARAELVTIENELDETKIMIGNGKALRLHRLCTTGYGRLSAIRAPWPSTQNNCT